MLDLLTGLELDPRTVVVELNREIVRRPALESTTVRDGDTIELVHFVGGAVLGSYPHIAYDAFLRRLGDDAGVVVVATPYELGVDHGAIARECQSSLAAAWSRAAARGVRHRDDAGVRRGSQPRV